MDPDNKDNNFVDNTVLSTPEPKASSTIQKKKQFKSVYHHVPVENDTDDSLGILSVKSVDLVDCSLDTDSKALLRKQRMLANDSLHKASRLSSLPSRYLRSSEISKNMTESYLNISGGSTISESDLLRNAGKTLYGDTSTPRSSISSDNGLENPKPKVSLGKSLAELSQKIRNPDIALDSFTEEFQKIMQSVISEDSDMFVPAEAAEAKLLADEVSWRKANDMPGQSSLCFTDTSFPLKVSVGEFFKQKSESISDLGIVAKSPEKHAPPVPLIDYEPSLLIQEFPSQEKQKSPEKHAPPVPFIDYEPSLLIQEFPSQEKRSSGAQESLSVSKIAQILQDTDQTPQRAMNCLLNKGKKSHRKSNVPALNNTSNKYLDIIDPIKDSTKLLESAFSSSESCNKENVNFLNIQDSANSSMASRDSPVEDSRNTTMMSRKSPDYQTQTDHSTTSVRSASSLSNLINGKLPIEATKTEMVWGSVKPGKSQIQELIIRNKSQNRLRLQCHVSGPSYKILKDRPDAEYVSIARYVLQPGESKPISVMFAPIYLGAAVDSISFTPVDPNLQQSKPQRVHLYGFGGHTNVEIDNLTKDVTGRYWFCLGQLDNKTPLCKAITVRNTGTLPAFGYITFDSREMYSMSPVDVSPERFVIMPQQHKEVLVTYTPSRNDLVRIQTPSSSSLIEIGFLKLVSGAEVSRGRIRRLCEQAVDKGLGINQLCKKLIEHFPGEHMPSDLQHFKESIRNMAELIKEFTSREIALTLQQDPDSTLLVQCSDETLDFESLYQESTLNIEEFKKNCFKLEPTCIILTLPIKSEDVLLLTSEYSESVQYNVKSDSNNVIVSPTAGTLDPGESKLIKVKYTGSTDNVIVHEVSVILENSILEASVKVLQLR